MSLRVLLVEDDALLGDGIQAGLKLADYAVDWVRDGEASPPRPAASPSTTLCVLDLGLPKKDGLAVLKDLRGRGNATRCSVLTAREHPRRQDRRTGRRRRRLPDQTASISARTAGPPAGAESDAPRARPVRLSNTARSGSNQPQNA